MRESQIPSRHSDILIFFSILIQIKVVVQTLGVSRDLRQAHFLTKRNKKWDQCNKCGELTSIGT